MLASVLQFEQKGVRGFKAVTEDGHSIAIVADKTSSALGCDSVLHVPAANTLSAIAEGLAFKKGQWLHPKVRRATDDARADASLLPEEIVKTWRNQIVLKVEDPEGGTPGLRSPQIGAVYATLAHWSTSDKPASVVMPTGTGKTETMLALLVAARLGRLLVVVPNDNARSQVASKFMELSVLRACGCLGDRAQPTEAAIPLQHHDRNNAARRRSSRLIMWWANAGFSSVDRSSICLKRSRFRSCCGLRPRRTSESSSRSRR